VAMEAELALGESALQSGHEFGSDGTIGGVAASPREQPLRGLSF
jgi:hypothetical protein